MICDLPDVREKHVSIIVVLFLLNGRHHPDCRSHVIDINHMRVILILLHSILLLLFLLDIDKIEFKSLLDLVENSWLDSMILDIS